jgi:dihydroneopterin aldolase
MGRIEITNMEFYAYHGHYQEEQIVGNKFLVDLSIETDLEPAARSDSLKDALNYQQAYMIVEREMKVKSQLMEHIAGRILDALYREMTGILRATVKVSKMNPPVGGRVERVSVTMTR